MPWKSYANQDFTGSDVVQLQILQGGAVGNDGDFVEAMKGFCVAKGYVAFNVCNRDGPVEVFIKNIPTSTTALGGMKPVTGVTFYVNE